MRLLAAKLSKGVLQPQCAAHNTHDAERVPAGQTAAVICAHGSGPCSPCFLSRPSMAPQVTIFASSMASSMLVLGVTQLYCRNRAGRPAHAS
jgi:hypothetical protein